MSGAAIMRESTIRLLVVHARYTDQLSYFDDWFDAFHRYPGFRVEVFDVAVLHREDALRRMLRNCDAVVLLHSTNGDTTATLRHYADVLSERRVPLLSFVGNEANLPGVPIAEKRRVFEKLRPEWIATQLLPEAGAFLFGDLAQKAVVSIPHALNPDAFRAETPVDDRPMDIGTRVARYPPHLGDDDRNRIADTFSMLGPQLGLRVDISNARYSRRGWASFLNRCKGTVSTESGSWFLEQDDFTVNAIRAYVLANAGGYPFSVSARLRRLGEKHPRLRLLLRRLMAMGSFRSESMLSERASYGEIYERFFAGRSKAPVYGKCISSRHFDAIGTRTCQIMFPGRFNDILIADRHYLALKGDFSNLADVLERFRDPVRRARIADEAYEFVMDGHTYDHRMHQVAGILAGARASP